MSEFKCTLWPSGEVLNLSDEETLLSALKKAGKKIKSSCGGCASCGDCVVTIKSGDLNLTPQSFEELRLLGNVFHITKERLSCQTKMTGDVTIDISAHEKNTFTGKGEKEVSKSTTTRLKKREEIEKSVRENEEKKRSQSSDSWYRHWEKEGEDDPSKQKKLGGNKRPRAFNYTDPNKDEQEK